MSATTAVGRDRAAGFRSTVDESFGYVLSWNVIFHGTLGDVGRRLAEIGRILKPGGHDAVKAGCAIRPRPDGCPDTFIRGSDAKAHPHYHCDLAGLAARYSR